MSQNKIFNLIRQNANVQTAFKKTMGSIASQVMILTAAHRPSQPTHHLHSIQTNQFKGATLSSVVSLSMDPHPLLQFNLKVPSFTSENLHHNGLMALHVLYPSQESSALARNFSRNGKVIDGKFVSSSPFHELVKDEDYEYYDNHQGLLLPILKKVCKIMICKKKKVLKIQDHEIWIVQVLDVLEGTMTDKEGGLLNFNRKFHDVGLEVE